jgi:hypothetical protein
MPRTWLIHLAAWPAGAYVALCTLAFLFQRDLMYFPDRAPEAALLAQARRAGLGPWRDPGGGLRGWKSLQAGGGAGRILAFHGNAGCAVQRAYLARGLQAPAVPVAWDVYILEYPGYGARPGSPSEAALVAAGLEALDALGAEGRRPTVLLGESLGSAVAARCAALRPEAVDGLLLVTPLTSMVDVGKVHYAFLPGFLVRDRLDASRALKARRVPLAVLVAERDEVIPAELGRRLFADHEGPKRLWTAPGAGHNNWDASPGNPLWCEASDFLRAHAGGPKTL